MRTPLDCRASIWNRCDRQRHHRFSLPKLTHQDRHYCSKSDSQALRQAWTPFLHAGCIWYYTYNHPGLCVGSLQRSIQLHVKFCSGCTDANKDCVHPDSLNFDMRLFPPLQAACAQPRKYVSAIPNAASREAVNAPRNKALFTVTWLQSLFFLFPLHQASFTLVAALAAPLNNDLCWIAFQREVDTSRWPVLTLKTCPTTP